MSTTLQETTRSRVAQGYILLFVILAVGIVTGGYFFHRHDVRDHGARVARELTAIGELKVNELVQFRRERLADAAILSQSAAFAVEMRRALDAQADGQAQGQLRAWLHQHLRAMRCNRVFLLDAQGVERVAVPGAVGPVPAALTQGVAVVLQSKRIVFQDFYYDEREQQIFLAVLVPIQDDQAPGRVLGIAGLRIDPSESLYPTFNNWPVPNETAEVKLVRRDGDAALYVNNLRTRQGMALTERVPLTETKRTAVMAVLGRRGLVEGVNKSGNAVLGYVQAVPDSPWFVVLRVETEEAYAPVRKQMRLTIILVTTLLAVLGTGLGLIWNRQRSHEYREMAEAAAALRVSEERHRAVIENLGEGVGHVDLHEHFTFVNRAASEIFGLPPGDLLGRSLQEFVSPEQFARIREQTGRRQAGETSAYEIEINRPNGDQRSLLVTAVPQFDQQGKFAGTFGVFRDITERRRAQEALRQSEASLQAILDSAADGLLAVGLENQVLMTNPRFLEMWRIPPDLLANRDDATLLNHVLAQLVDPESFLRKVQELYQSKEKSFDTLRFKDGRVFDRLSCPMLQGEKACGRVWSFRDVTEREHLLGELRQSLAEVKTLGGLLPICAGCKMIRDDTGYWNQVEVYIQQHTDAKFTHGMCPECIKKYFPGMD